MTAPEARPRQRRRRWLRWLAWSFVGSPVLFAGLVAVHAPVPWPFDVAINLGGVTMRAELRAPADGKRRVVVLQHGLWRTSAALGRLARTLAAHGYEVHNPGYPSTAGRVEEFSERLARYVDRIYAAGPVAELSFVGHSLGGVVIEDYLRRPDAHAPTHCVYLGTPHRGAILADLRKHWWLFRFAMGTGAALQLSPGDPLFEKPIPYADRSGTVVGDLGDGNASIPGHDDGTVGVAEATFAGVADSVTLPVGHTRIVLIEAPITAVLEFLCHGRFGADRGRAGGEAAGGR